MEVPGPWQPWLSHLAMGVRSKRKWKRTSVVKWRQTDCGRLPKPVSLGNLFMLMSIWSLYLVTFICPGTVDWAHSLLLFSHSHTFTPGSCTAQDKYTLWRVIHLAHKHSVYISAGRVKDCINWKTERDKWDKQQTEFLCTLTSKLNSLLPSAV